MPNPTVSWTVYGLVPTVGDIQEFWHDIQTNSLYGKAVDCYLNALASASESEIASELYKVLETFEIKNGEKAASNEIGYPSAQWKSLKYNLNWGKRHVKEKFQQPSRMMSADECLNATRGIIEKFRKK